MEGVGNNIFLVHILWNEMESYVRVKLVELLEVPYIEGEVLNLCIFCSRVNSM